MQSPSETRNVTFEVAGLHGDPIHCIEALLLGDSRAVDIRICVIRFWNRRAGGGDFST